MKAWRPVVALATLITLLSATGCAVQPRAIDSARSELTFWQGRLAVRVEPDQASSQPQAQSFSAGFELTGSAQAGALTLFTPLGSTAAALSWTQQTAAMRTPEKTLQFESLDALIRNAVGTDLPVAALFAWLAGDNMSAAGWHADLSQLANGRITARRLQPPPMAELLVILEK